MNTRDEQIEFIRTNGRRIAACAWNGYQHKGRGLVCVMSDLHNELLHQVPFDFLPEIDTSKVIDPWYGTKESRMVSGYDPQTEVVIAFFRKGADNGTDIDSYKVKTSPAPPLADEREDD
jgi:hypothetical protein